WIAEGVIGEPRMVRAGHSFPLVRMDRDDDFRWKEELGGGSLMDLGCYCVNTARYIFEEDPERVYSTAFYHPDYTAEAQLEGIMEFSNDRTAIIDSSFLLYDRAKFEVIGREGNIVVDHAYRSRGKDLEFRVFKDDEVEIERIEGVDEFMLEIDNFARALRGLEEQGISREDTIGNMRAIEALYKSSKRREPILLD
ncbi:MAG: Gfo/Idh/MocA family protein, partial [Candidatus Hadarchaeia archaeon]